jgi:hypothetical protein
MFKFFKKDKPEIAPRHLRLMEGQDNITFRRSRTITGSISSDVRSAAEDNSNLKSHRQHLHELRSHRRGIMLTLVATLVLLGLTGWMLGQYIGTPLQARFDDQLIKPPGMAKYNASLAKYFENHSMEHFAFNLREEELERYMFQEHPEIANIDIEVSYLGEKDILFEFRRPLLVWKSRNSELYVDKKGVAFTVNYFDPPSVVVEDKSGAQLEQSDIIASSRIIRFLGQVIGYVNEAKIGDVNKVVIPSNSLRQIDMFVSGREYPIKTHIDRQPYSQAQDLIAAVRFFDGKGIAPAYLDARVEGRAFYRDR